MNITVQLDQRQLNRVERLMREYPNGAARVITRAINRTATAGRSMIIKEISSAMGVIPKGIKDNITVTRATFKNQRAIVRIADKSIPAVFFKHRVSKTQGVTITFRRDKGPERMPHAFKIHSKIAGRKAIVQRRPGGTDAAWHQDQVRERSKLTRRRRQAERRGGVRPTGSRMDWTGPLTPRLPLIERYGPSILSIYGPSARQIDTDLTERMSREIESGITWVLSRK